ncbi:MAG: SIMPL domain-containing protein [Sinomicrobium sp.]|nr:SIMPL domain-containing protein [Sinomicrobium sp.]
MKKILILIAVSTLGLYAQEKQEQHIISVSGEGTVKIVPDQVALSIRVEHTGNTAKEVKAMNDAAINNVLQFCKKMKIDRKDVNTQYINLNKNYDYQKKEYHYDANQSIRILLRDLEKYETVMQGLLESGVNRIDGVEFRSSEFEKYQSEARKKAVLHARQKAGEYAEALQQSVGKALTISETTAYSPVPVFNRGMLATEMAAADTASGGPAIAIGEMSVSATVNIAFELK